MNGNDLLQLVAIGAIAGAFGQGLRAIVGIKKASEEAAAQGSTLRSDGLDVGRLVFSLFIGAIAGGVGIFTITGFKPGATANITPEIFFGVIGIGYAGTDFIEGFIRTQLPKGMPSANTASFTEANLVAAFERANALGAADRIKQSCDRLLKLPANAGDCSAFAKAVAQDFSVTLTGQANDIVDQLNASNGWTVLGADADAGQRAAAAAAKGEFVVGARKEAGNGHVVIVVAGSPLAHGKYPFAFWGKLNDPANAGFNKTVNWAWNSGTRDSVTYASRRIA